jgi:hypothetical protein
MGEYADQLNKRMRDHHRDKVIATAALCGAKFFQASRPGGTTYGTGKWSTAGSDFEGWHRTKFDAAKAYLKEKGVQVDYGF